MHYFVKIYERKNHRLAPSDPGGPSSAPFGGGASAHIHADVLAVATDGHDVGVVVERGCYAARQLVALPALPTVLRLVVTAFASVVLPYTVVMGPAIGVINQLIELDQLHAPHLDAVQVCNLDVVRAGVVSAAQVSTFQ